MAIALLSSLLIHIVWLSRAYNHTNAAIKKYVRIGAAIGSLIVTTSLFCLVERALNEYWTAKINLGANSASRQVTRVISSPDNSVCYVETQTLDGDQ